MALNMGLREANPLMAPIAANPLLLAAVKGLPLLGANHIRKNGTDKEKENLKKAMKILNGLMVGVVVNNLVQMSRNGSK